MRASVLHRRLLLYEALAIPATAKSISLHSTKILTHLTFSRMSWLTHGDFGA